MKIEKYHTVLASYQSQIYLSFITCIGEIDVTII